MADIVSRAIRSRMMSGIRSSNTKPEIVIRSALHGRGYRFRVHRRDLPGSPDVVLPKFRSVIFVNGCFWHGHACRLFKWRVAIVWECSIRGAKKDLNGVIEQIEVWLKGTLPFIEISE